MNKALRKDAKIKLTGYDDINYINSGGNSHIYSCKKNQKLCALKIIKYDFNSMDINYKKRILNEIDFQKNQKSNNIVKIIDNDYITINKKKYIYYTMPFYEKNLTNLMADKTLSRINILKLYVELCSGLKYAHNKKIIHRDIKPDNILYDVNNDKLLLADFGIAHFSKDNITNSKSKLANFKYASPEQRNFKKVDKTTDIYSMGLILNEIFTGNIPDGVDYEKIELHNPEYSEIDTIVEKMLYSNPNNRIKNISVVQQFIKKFLEIYNTEEKSILEKINNFGITDNEIKMKIISDLIFANNLLINNRNIEKYNLNYNNNILYNINQDTLDTSFLLYYENLLQYYIKEENINWNSYEDWINESKIEEKNTLIHNIYCFLKKLKIYESAEGNCARVMKMLSCLYYQNLEQLSNNIDSIYKDFIKNNNILPILRLVSVIKILKNNYLLNNPNIIYFINNIITENANNIKELYLDKNSINKYYAQVEEKYGITIDIIDKRQIILNFNTFKDKERCIKFFSNAPLFLEIYDSEITKFLNKMKISGLDMDISEYELHTLLFNGYIEL